MSASSSGRSTPAGAPPPPTGGDSSQPSSNPNPLTVGTHFVKQYYKVLSTSPDQIVRFYQPSSVLSHGIGSQPSHPTTVEESGSVGGGDDGGAATIKVLQDRFILEGYEKGPVRFELEHGAIDAQVSVNGGVLLVVTGHLVYLESSGSRAIEKRKAFVHTFFLGSWTHHNKRSYYVHNDILRFLHDRDDEAVIDEEVEEAAEAGTVLTSNASSEGTEAAAAATETSKAVVVAPVATVAAAVVAAAEPEEAPGGGVEETKEVLREEEAQEKVAVAKDREAEPEAASKGAEAAPKPDAIAATVPKAVPGSWASLVASGAGSSSTPATPTRGTPVRPAASPAAVASPTAAAPKVTLPTPASPAAAAANAVPPVEPAVVVADGPGIAPGARPAKHVHIKRDPDSTLVIKNINGDTKESDVLGLFEPYAAPADAKVVGITVSAHKGIAFVDFDSPAPVLAAVEQHAKEPFQINGRELDVYQKTLEQRNRRAFGERGGGRGGYRGGPPGNGSSFRGGGGRDGGGRQPFRRGGRGERDRRGGGGR